MNPSIPHSETYRPRPDDPDAPREWDSINGAHDSHGFDPNQPRVPAGNPDGGQWTGDGGGQRPTAQPVFVPAAQAAIALGSRMVFAGQKAIEAALLLFTWLSAQNRADKQAILVFKAREYRPNGRGGLVLDEVKLLDRDDVEAACPRFGEVQKRTEQAVDFVRRNRVDLSPSIFGTDVHTNLKQQIDELVDRHFKAEMSFVKLAEEEYGTASAKHVEMAKIKYGEEGSIRVDVLEKVSTETVCVYDIKTGRRGLSGPRMDDIAQRVFRSYPETQRIIITEVRPRQ